MLMGTVIVTSTSPNGAQPGCCFTFSPWCDNMAIIEGGFAMDELLEEIKKSATFRVDVDSYDWFCNYPDVIFEIIVDGVPSAEQTAIAVSALESFVTNYNKWHFLRPIHYVSDIDHLPKGPHPRGIYIHIDFGRCSPRVLPAVIQAIQNTNLPIFRVALL